MFADLLTEGEAARELGRCARTLKRWRDLREGPPFIRVGRQILYRRDAVRAWLLSHEQNVQPIRPPDARRRGLKEEVA
jgi:hypothetical protein